jgi:hypothetical protein
MQNEQLEGGSKGYVRSSPLGQINKICGPSHLKDAELLQAIDKRIASIDKAGESASVKEPCGVSYMWPNHS